MRLTEVLAKDTGETLKQHIENCLRVLSSIMEIYPEVHVLCEVEDFYEHLFYAVFLHDFGKAASGFQNQLRNDGEIYGYRHEILSAGFISCINVDVEYRRAIGLSIITHHKDLQKIRECYRKIDDEGLTREKLFDERIKDIIPNFAYLEKLLSLIHEYSKRYIGRALDNYNSIKWDQIINGYMDVVPWYLDSVDSGSSLYIQGLYGMFLKGFLTACDHLSSASVYEVKKGIKDIKAIYQYENYTSVQLAAMKCKGSSIIISPTGSGKTEASLFWADANQSEKKGKRTYYILPYTASINAMYKRLQNSFSEFTGDNELVGMLHSKADYFIYSSLSKDDDSSNYENIRKISRATQSLTNKIFRPYKIMTPFQLLKAFFSVKGFEQKFSEMTGGLFILDEIHAYNPRTTALLLESLMILKKKYDVRILIMSATLPKFIKDKFIDTLNIKYENVIVMNKDELNKYTRHRVEIVPGEITDNMELISRDIDSGKRILVVCNTVKRAQDVYMQLKMKEGSAILHGRFILRDREKIEKNLEKLKLLVGTQAIEVSLDIDYDVLYTEPAPIDALLQRFGRINRRVHKKGNKTISPVYIFEKGSDKDRYIYDSYTVSDTLKVLRSVNILREDIVQELVDFVYRDGYTGKQLEEFTFTTESFRIFYSTVVPFINNENIEEKFYSLFDNYSVVPIKFISEYTEEIRQKRYFEAIGYTLGISRGQFYKLRNDNRVSKEGSMYFINCEYDANLGLLLDEYPSNVM